MEKPKLNDHTIKKKKKLLPMARAINSVALKKVKMPVTTTTTTKDINEPGKYVRMNKNSCSTTLTLIDEKSLNGKKRKIKHEKTNHASSEIVSLPKRMKIKNGEKSFNHDSRNNDTQKKNDNLCHNKGLKNVQQEVMKNKKVADKNSHLQQSHSEIKSNQMNGIKNEIQPPPVAGLTLTFREQLMANLKGSRFRYLNEMLYTTDGKNAANIFKDDPMAFKAYHDGYRQQVKHWPINPLDRIIKAIRKM